MPPRLTPDRLATPLEFVVAPPAEAPFSLKSIDFPETPLPAEVSVAANEKSAKDHAEREGRLALASLGKDWIDRAWRIVDPLIARWDAAATPAHFPNYAARSWGPAAADELLRRDGREWRAI